MQMYKIIYNNSIIDVVKRPTFVRFLKTGQITVTNKTSAQGIAGSDQVTVYSFIPNTKYTMVTIAEINQKEFERLKSLLDSATEGIPDDGTLTEVKTAKINSLSKICKSKITSGFSIKLSDEHYHGFKLTTEDQINLMSIENQLLTDENLFVYHATNEPCRAYKREDMLKIIKAYKKHVLYHTTYFNIAKQYIKNSTNMEKINSFNYGNDVLGFTQDSTLKAIIEGGPVL